MTQDAEPAKILIVEDEALIARELTHRLTSMGWEVVGTAFGEEAVELALETQPDLLLSDINLRHGLSGIDLAQRIQSLMDVPVVFLTAYSDEETVTQAKKLTPFGYIIKPVENRELQITIEMALYKFRVEKELREKQQLLQTALACIGDALLFMDTGGNVVNLSPEAKALVGEGVLGRHWQSVVGKSVSVRSEVEAAFKENNVGRIAPFLLSRQEGSTKLVDGIVGPIDDGAVLILRDLGQIEDPVRIEPREHLATLGAETLAPTESSFCQLLIAPDELLGEQLSAVVDQVRKQLDSTLRATDLVSVFSNSIVSVSLPYTDIDEGRRISAALLDQLAGFGYDGNSVRFSAGLAFSVGGDHEPIELFRRAGNALDAARRTGGNQLMLDGGEQTPETTKIQGGRDYRHVVLLWNVMNSITSAPDKESMCDEFTRHLLQVFGADRAALLEISDKKLGLSVGYLSHRGRTEHISDLQFSEDEFAACRTVTLAAPLILQDAVLLKLSDDLVLFLSGADFNEADHQFLITLGTYFLSGMGRFLVGAVVDEPTDESAPMLVHGSLEMRQVLESADLAAPTDATILLEGESGTGKELLAKYVHERSERADYPLIVVDCGAVTPSLIESELFGHVKGAFTGATSNFTGRLKEAAGGTVLLDEVGELPLDTQVKLLRFVQERQLAPVGSNKYESVDARVIAATNRDLKEMVAEGSFREDLYFRLNVFSIAVPPLRDRRDDILKLAHHYLNEFTTHYKKDITGFTPEAERALHQYDWPGNIRELSNVINRAVILSKDNLIWPIHLGVFSEEPLEPPVESQPVSQLQVINSIVDLGLAQRNPQPVGRYLEEDFILMSVARHDHVLNRAAQAIDVPESTLRRKIQKIESTYASMDPDRPDNWPVHPVFYDWLMQQAEENTELPLAIIEKLLVAEIENRDIPKSQGARLMGVSMPTYRRLANTHRRSANLAETNDAKRILLRKYMA